MSVRFWPKAATLLYLDTVTAATCPADGVPKTVARQDGAREPTGTYLRRVLGAPLAGRGTAAANDAEAAGASRMSRNPGERIARQVLRRA
jgi:hypothetical protein